MTSNQSHKALVFGSISIDKIINRYGTYENILGGSASYALLATPKNTCQLIGVVGDDFPKEHFDFLGNHSNNLDDLTIEKGKTFTWGGEYQFDFSSRKTLYVDPGISEKYKPVLSSNSRNCDYLLLGNTLPRLQLMLLEQIESDPFVILDTFKLYIDIANKDLKKAISKSDLLCINYNEALALSDLHNPTIKDMADCILQMGTKSLIIKKGEEVFQTLSNSHPQKRYCSISSHTN